MTGLSGAVKADNSCSAADFYLLQRRPEFVAVLEQQLIFESAGLSEHELIQRLDDAGSFTDWLSGDKTLALFQKHFATMHCLYHLQSRYAKKGRELTVSPLSIRLRDLESGAGTDVGENTSGIGDFYRDWKNFESATPESVSDLLRGFWQRYQAVDKVAEALEILELRQDADWSQVQAQYRRLATECHPDKGGDRERFTRVRQAYEVLKSRYR